MEKAKQREASFLKVEKLVTKIMKGFSYPSAACLLIMAALATVNVIYSKLTMRSIPSTNDWIAYLLIPAVFLAAGSEIMDRGLVYVDLVTGRFPPIVQKIILFCSYLLGAGLSVFLAVLQFQLMVDYYQSGRISSIDRLHFPLWPFMFILAVGLLLMAFTMVMQSMRAFLVKETIKPEEEMEMEAEEQKYLAEDEQEYLAEEEREQLEEEQEHSQVEEQVKDQTIEKRGDMN